MPVSKEQNKSKYSPYKYEYDRFLLYLKDNRWYISISCALFLIIWSPWIFHINPRVDTELLLNYPTEIYNWLDIGRQGLLLTEFVFGISKYNQFLYTCFGYVFIAIGATLFGYLFWRAGRDKSLVCSAFVLIGFLQPVLAEQFFFDLQMFQISWAYILTASACGLSTYAIRRRSVPAGALSVFLMIWSFSSYQAFVIIYVSSVIGVFLLLFRREMSEGIEIKSTVLLRYILMNFALFLIAFFCNALITELWFSSGDYIIGQVNWFNTDIGSWQLIIRDLFISLKSMLLGAQPFYSSLFCVFACLVVLLYVFDVRKTRLTGFSKAIYILSACMLQICPFLLTFYMGHAPIMRSQIYYPFVLGLDMLLLLTRSYSQRILKFVICILCVSNIWTQTNVTMRLIYTDIIRAREDMLLMSQIQARLNELPNKKIAFVGRYDNKLNAACQRGELIGISAFNYDRDADPKYYFSSSRICNIMKTAGFSLDLIPSEQILDARVNAMGMPAWPDSGSVSDRGEYIVVKLSEDEWPWEVEAYAPGTYHPDLIVYVSEDFQTMTITLLNHEDYEGILFPIWSEENGQDDLVWYEASKLDDGTWVYTVDLTNHPSVGEYHVHCYGRQGTSQTFLTDTVVNPNSAASDK